MNNLSGHVKLAKLAHFNFNRDDLNTIGPIYNAMHSK